MPDAPSQGQPFSCGIADSAIAEAGQVPLDALHFDVDAILHAFDAIRPVAERLGIPAPLPKLAGFCYAPLAGLGLEIDFPRNSEPKPKPLISSPDEIDDLTGPDDYLASDVTQRRLAAARALKARCPDANTSIGHTVEGPVTTATLILGQGFFTLPYDAPDRAHKLLDFSVRSAVSYAKAISEHMGAPLAPGPRGIPDDFAGMLGPAMFGEFVVPYWNQLYEGLMATSRSLHSELLRVEHMRFLEQAQIGTFDPSADQYLTPELLRDHCPARFGLSLQNWHVDDLSATELQDRYRHLASFQPSSIGFSLARLDQEPKIQSLLEVAREMQ